MSASKDKINELVEKAVGSKIQKDMEMVSRAFHGMTEKYSFLFDGDMLQTQRMLMDACFSEKVSVMEQVGMGDDESEESIYFDMSAVIRHVPDSMKVDLYERVMEQFVTKLTIDDINKKKG